MIDLKREGDVFVLRLDAGENRFNSEMIRAWNVALDEVEAAEGPKALVTTGTGKFYSNGLDLDYMREVDADEYLKSVLAIMGRCRVLRCSIALPAMNTRQLKVPPRPISTWRLNTGWTRRRWHWLS